MISAISCVCVVSEWMMGNAVQCAVWCESQYDGEATSGGYWRKATDRIRDSIHMCLLETVSFQCLILSRTLALKSQKDWMRKDAKMQRLRSTL